MPPHRVYVEPYGGAASVLLRKPRAEVEVYNDLDDEIVGIFRILRDSAQCRELIRSLRRTPYSRRELERAFEPSAEPLERARRAIVRCHMAFHHSAIFSARKFDFYASGHRSGGRGRASEWATCPRTLAAVCRRLRGVVIEHRDALDVIRLQDAPDALFYVDPPYVGSTRSRDATYRHDMTDAQHDGLLALLRGIKGRAMVAGYPSALYDGRLHGWERLERRHYAKGSMMRPRTEVLWISPPKA
jgi:DNA adenine methylase